MFIRLNKRAQSTAEYAILIAIVIGAVVAMQVYVKRGLQARVRDVVDDVTLGGQATDAQDIFSGGQYEPYYTVGSTALTNQTANEAEDLKTGGAVARTSNVVVNAERNQVTGWEGQGE